MCAQALLADMRGRQVAPSVVTYNTLIDAYANEGWLEQVALPGLPGSKPGAMLGLLHSPAC